MPCSRLRSTISTSSSDLDGASVKHIPSELLGEALETLDRAVGKLLWTEWDQKNREVFMLRESLFNIGECCIILIPFHRLDMRTHRHIPPIALLADTLLNDL